jgi:hypothetical protein
VHIVFGFLKKIVDYAGDVGVWELSVGLISVLKQLRKVREGFRAFTSKQVGPFCFHLSTLKAGNNGACLSVMGRK